MNRACIIFSLAWPLMSIAQWDVPASIEMTGSSAVDRQVLGLAEPLEGSDGISQGAIRSQLAWSAIAIGTNTYVMNLTPPAENLHAGMRVTMRPSQSNAAGCSLEVDGLGAFPIVKLGSQPLDSADLREGVPYHLLFDGAAFHVLDPITASCPPGYWAVGRDLCIQNSVNDSTTFYGAANYCESQQARLCTFGEWYQACTRLAGFTATVTAFEWIDHAANDVNKAKLIGYDINSQSPDCTLGSLRVPVTPVQYRCCRSR